MKSSVIDQFQKTFIHFNLEYGIHLEQDGSICISSDLNISAKQNKTYIEVFLGTSKYQRTLKTQEDKERIVRQYVELLYKYLADHNLVKLTDKDKNYLPGFYFIK